MINWPLYFWIMLKGSFFATSGTGNVPSIHADMMAQGWATERQFAEALAVGQISPGPTGLWVVSLGYLTGGWLGTLITTLTIIVPPLLVLLIDRLHGRIGEHPAVQGFTRGLSLAVVGIFLIVLAELLAANGWDWSAVLIVIAAILLAKSGRVPVIVILAIAAVAGIGIYR